MARLCSTTATRQNIKLGADKNDGKIDGFLLSYDKQAAPLDLAAAALKSTWVAMQKQEINTRIFALFFDDEKTPMSIEKTYHTDGNGVERETNTLKKPGEYWIAAGYCSRGVLAALENQTSMWAWAVLSKAGIVGQEITPNTTEQVAVELSATYAFADKSTPSGIIVRVNQEIFEKNAVGVIPESTFNVKSLEETNISTLVFRAGNINTLTTQSVFVSDANGVDVDNLSVTGTSHFLVKTTDGVTLAVSSATRVGTTNEFVVTFAASIEGGTNVLYYETPAISGEAYELIYENGMSFISTAL